MSITLLSDLISTPDTKKIVLAEITPRENLVGESWTQHGTSTNAWYISYLYETITLADSSTTKLVKEVEQTDGKMEVDGTAMSSQTSIVGVDANSNSFWHDTANSLLYVNVGGDPSTTVAVLLAFFTLRFATEGVVLNSKYYEPYLLSAPNIKQSTENILSGYSKIGGGNLFLNNNTGLFDIIVGKFILEHGTVKLLFGGEDLPYSEYQVAFTGHVFSKEWTEEELRLDLKSTQMILNRIVPENTFTLATYPNLDPNMVGVFIPHAYGTFPERLAPIVAAVNESLGTDQVQYKITDHELNSVDGAWVSYDNGSTWTQLSFTDPLTGANQYRVASLPNSTIDVEFTSGGYVSNETKVKVAFKGEEGADGNLLTSCSDIVKHILKDHASFTMSKSAGTSTLTTANKLVDSAANFTVDGIVVSDVVINTTDNTSTTVSAVDSSTTLSLNDDIFASGEYYEAGEKDMDLISFKESKDESESSIAIYLDSPQKVKDIIDKICLSDNAFFYVDGDGKFVYKVWAPGVDTSAPEYDRTDLLSFSALFDSNEHFTRVRVGYSQSPTNNNYLYASNTSTESENEHGESRQKLVNTYLDNFSDANILSQRLLFLHKEHSVRITGTLKWQIIQKNIGDKIYLTSARAPFNSSAGYAKRQMELTSISKNLAKAEITFECDDLKGMGEEIGQWTGSTAPGWATSTESEKQTQGFWSDVNGFIDPSDPKSKNKSRWW